MAQSVLVAGAVIGVAFLMLRVGAVATFGWVVAFAAVGFTGAALWAALSRDREPGAVRATGWWSTTFLLATSLAVTSGGLLVRLLVALGVLTLLGLGLTAVAHPRRASEPCDSSAYRRDSSRRRRPDAA